jgi:hypothetical protein
LTFPFSSRRSGYGRIRHFFNDRRLIDLSLSAAPLGIGTDGTQTGTCIAGISSTTIGGATQPVVVKIERQLGDRGRPLGIHSIAHCDSSGCGGRSSGCANRVKRVGG